jgi:small basic protein
MYAVLAALAGVVLGFIFKPTVPLALQPYLPIAVVAVLVAGLIVYVGDQLGVGGQLSTGVVVVLGIRIFGNVAAIRRHLFRA